MLCVCVRVGVYVSTIPTITVSDFLKFLHGYYIQDILLLLRISEYFFCCCLLKIALNFLNRDK